MAILKPPKSELEMKKLTLSKLRKEYTALAQDYIKLLDCDWLYCHKCNTFLPNNNFYKDSRFNSGVFPVCKSCLLKMVEQRKYDKDKPNETKDSVKKVLLMMDKPYYDSTYESVKKTVSNNPKGRSLASPFGKYISMMNSLPQFLGKTWADGDVAGDDGNIGTGEEIKKRTIKRFGAGLSNEDYLFLQDEYEDWVSRYECKTKAQEELFERLCFKKLEIFKATRKGASTKELDESFQKLMNTANITPKQNSLDILSEGMNLGQLIEKWEANDPLPETDPELKDVDHIAEYIEVFFKGHLAKMLNLKNPLQRIYEGFMKKLTVDKPEYSEEEDSEELYEKIFGHKGEDG